MMLLNQHGQTGRLFTNLTFVSNLLFFFVKDILQKNGENI